MPRAANFVSSRWSLIFGAPKRRPKRRSASRPLCWRVWDITGKEKLHATPN
eukprot:CAMPEP_0204285174 /NCGR_PEP_ID=MMETSP0468-20130131/50056_1 /ASSEMBLY_ACC=CAM_ASM_000383 /TAXON_ID=2969 /ORGANISM="Oxyrrhis marina" /LENGTH=50 /DNA_ID=CAMNT_0051262985 /DNA_START=774 /DNA_END=926 /DNA_ORIENTATION=+